METTALEETMNILKRLSQKNQAYFMTLVRVAEVAENGMQNIKIEQSNSLKTDTEKTAS